jgi:hypothetical protein
MKFLNITPNDLYGASYFGQSVAINSGDIAVVGAYGQDTYGKAYIYKKYSQEWKWQKIQEIAPLDGYGGDGFGYSVDINYEGNVLAISAPNSNSQVGAVYIYTGREDSWSQVEKIDGDNPSDYFGWNIDLNKSGNKLVIGSYRPVNSGFADLYQGSGTNWNKIIRFWDSGIGHSITGALYGAKVAINTGDYVFISAYGQDDVGAVYVYSETGNWSQLGILTGESTGNLRDPSGDLVFGPVEFGKSLHVTENAKNILIGSVGENELSGAVYLFKNTGNNSWNIDNKFTGITSRFGQSTFVNDSGNLIYASSLNNSGTIYSYFKPSNTWYKYLTINNLNPISGSSFGKNITLNKNYNTMVVGDPNYQTTKGNAYILSAPWDNFINYYGVNESEIYNYCVCNTGLNCRDCCGITTNFSIITGYKNNLNNLNLQLSLTIENLNCTSTSDIYKFYNHSNPVYTDIYQLGNLGSVYSGNILIKDIKPINNLINLEWKVFNLGKEYKLYTGLNINNY